MTANDIKWSTLCLVCCVAVVAMSRRRRIASITSWQKRQRSQKIYIYILYIAQRVSWVCHWTKSLSFIIHRTPLDSDGLWTQDLRNKHLQESTSPKLWGILQNPKCQCSCSFFFLIFLINPWDFFPGYPWVSHFWNGLEDGELVKSNDAAKYHVASPELRLGTSQWAKKNPKGWWVTLISRCGLWTYLVEKAWKGDSNSL